MILREYTIQCMDNHSHLRRFTQLHLSILLKTFGLQTRYRDADTAEIGQRAPLPEAMNVPLGQMRKRGRPSKSKKALLVQ